MKSDINEIVNEYQCEFKPRISIVVHIFTLSQLIEKHYEYNKPSDLLFIVFKIYIRLYKEKITVEKHKKFGISLKLVRMTKACIGRSMCKIKFGNSYSEQFETTVG